MTPSLRIHEAYLAFGSYSRNIGDVATARIFRIVTDGSGEAGRGGSLSNMLASSEGGRVGGAGGSGYRWALEIKEDEGLVVTFRLWSLEFRYRPFLELAAELSVLELGMSLDRVGSALSRAPSTDPALLLSETAALGGREL